MNNIIHKELSFSIVGMAMQVHNQLGGGFLEKVYENAMMVLCRKQGISAEQQKAIKVYFENEIVGEYFADILVDDKVIIELKVAESITNIHKAQLLNYLKATHLRLGLILNFGKEKLEYERLVL